MKTKRSPTLHKTLYFIRLCHAASYAFLFGFAFTFLFSSARFVQSLLGPYVEAVEKHSNLILVALLLASGVAHLLAFFTERLAKKEKAESAKSPPLNLSWRNPVFVFQLILSVIIVTRVVLQIPGPLQWEDNYHFSNVIHDPLFRFNPLIKTEHHTLASMAAYYSVQLLGMTKFAIRLPALLVTLSFLVLLNLTCLRFFPPMASLVAFTALSSNQMALLFMSSIRGYVFAMFFVLGSLYLILLQLFGPVSRRYWPAFLYVLVAYACALTHLFASLANGLLFLSVLIWLRFSDHPLSQKRKKGLALFVALYFGAVLPVYGYIFFYQMQWLERLGDFFKGGFPEIGPTLMRLMGASFAWYGKGILLSLLALGALRLRNLKKRTPDFVTLFLGVSLLFFTVVLEVLEVRLVETRFLLPFLTPFILALGVWIHGLREKRAVYFAGAVALLLCAAVPLQSTRSMYNYLTLNTIDYDYFLQQVVAKTSPLNKNCYSYSGEPNLIYFTRTLYLGEYQGVGQEPHCTNHYHIEFQSPPELPPVETRPTNEIALYQQVLNYQNEMRLFVRLPTERYLTTEPD